MISQCQHKNTDITRNFGYDVDPEGETEQHLVRCRDCGYIQIISHHTPFNSEKPIRVFDSEWMKPI